MIARGLIACPNTNKDKQALDEFPAMSRPGPNPMPPVDLPPRPRILVIVLRRLGDVLFATALTASLRRAYRDAVIDVLAFEGTAGILDGNPDIDRVVTMSQRPSPWQTLGLLLRLAKRYHLAISTQSGDRPTLFALVAGRRHVGPVDAGARGALRQRALWRSVGPQPGTHRLEDMMRLVDALGIARAGRLVCPGGVAAAEGERAVPARDGGETAPLQDGNYAVVHAAPMFQYKRWTTAGWRAVAAKLASRGLKVVATGGPGAEERAFLDHIWAPLPDVQRRDGQLSWPQLARLLAGARLFVGPDTSVTHLAAAAGCPTIALFGPTDPRQWGPVPATGLEPMWEAAGTIQRRGNVWLVQHPLPCLPCQKEGCDRHIGSFSKCLDDLPPERVMEAVEAALESVAVAASIPPPLTHTAPR
jgi:heptosyltransferase III